MAEKRLDYDRSLVPQETGWWCGPASTQTVLQGKGIHIPESKIAAEIEQIENPGRGDDRDGTDYVGLIEIYLDRTVPQAKYTSVYMPKDPPTKAQKDKLWRDLTRSIDAGWGVVANIVAPPSNRPAGTKGSVPPPYGWGTTYHYVALMGYDDDSGNRAVWIADSANFGGITGFWCPFEGRGSITSLIPPKGYCFADTDPTVAQPVNPPAPESLSWNRIGISSEVLVVKALAEAGHRPSLELLAEMAKFGSQKDAEVARVILTHIERINPVALQDFLKGK